MSISPVAVPLDLLKILSNNMEKIIVGLGNPGRKYLYTRHNAGWLILDRLIQELLQGQAKWHSKSRLLSQTITLGNNLLVKPQTMMNNSGQAVKALVNYYGLTSDDLKDRLLIIHDELDLPLGQTRWSQDSRSAGHKGVQSIIDCLGTQNFNRCRIGIKPPQSLDPDKTMDYVLSNFSNSELKKLQTLSLEPIYHFLEDNTN
mgnify:FL=1